MNTWNFDVPMDLAVSHWRMINDKGFRERMTTFGKLCEQLQMQNAQKLLEACESLGYSEIYEFVKLNPPTGDVIAALVQLAKQAQKTNTAMKAAKIRHTENNATKAAVFDWLDSNMANFKSMDKAAEAVTKQQPITFRTARDYVGQWKKLRPAGTA